MNIVIKFEKILLGSAGTLKQNSHFFAEEDNFLVIYGDNLTDISYSSFLREHQRNDGVVTMACYEEEHPESKGIIETDAEGRILKFLEKPEPGKTVSKLANAGIYALSHDIFSYLHDFDKIPLDFGYDIFPFLLSKNETMFVYRMTESLLDIGTLESYTKAQRLAL